MIWTLIQIRFLLEYVCICMCERQKQSQKTTEKDTEETERENVYVTNCKEQKRF